MQNKIKEDDNNSNDYQYILSNKEDNHEPYQDTYIEKRDDEFN